MTRKTLYRILLIVSILFLGIHQLFQKLFHWNYWPLDNFLDPILGVIVLLALYRWEKHQTLQKATILVFTGIFMFISEVMFPYCSPKFTADWLDLIMIACGGCIFYALQPKNITT